MNAMAWPRRYCRDSPLATHGIITVGRFGGLLPRWVTAKLISSGDSSGLPVSTVVAPGNRSKPAVHAELATQVDLNRTRGAGCASIAAVKGRPGSAESPKSVN